MAGAWHKVAFHNDGGISVAGVHVQLVQLCTLPGTFCDQLHEPRLKHPIFRPVSLNVLNDSGLTVSIVQSTVLYQTSQKTKEDLGPASSSSN